MQGKLPIMPKISVIIPAYNCEGTIKEALDSILKQDYDNIEIIIVDDGSVDGTKEIIRFYDEKDERICPVFQANAGPSAARNTGLEKASGDLLMFVDADDKMEPNVLKYLICQMQQNECDMLISGVRKVYSSLNDKIYEREVLPAYSRYTNSMEIWNNIILNLKSGVLNSPWAKIYRKSIVDAHSIRMDTRLDMGEDLQFNLEYLEYCDSLLIIPCVSYIYLTQNSFLTNRYRENMFQCRRISIELLRNHFEKHKIDINIIHFLYLKLMIAQVMQEQEHGIDYKTRREKIQNLFRDKNVICAIKCYQSEGVMDKIILWILRTRSPLIVDLFSWISIRVRKLLPGRIARVSV